LNEQELYDKTVKCIRCGFCLEACPTFRLTGQETESPRGRIYLVRSAIEGEIAWNDTTKHLDRCLGCRACETACPSGVEYGDILEMAREKLEPKRPITQQLKRKLILKTITTKLLNLIPIKQLPCLPPIPRKEDAKQFPHHANAGTKGEIHLLTGCVMDNLYHTTNQAARYLLEMQGYKVNELKGICCKALHKHVGIKTKHPNLPKNEIIAVTSAGCGSSLKDRGYDAKDITELINTIKPKTTAPIRIVYQDACHLLHGQGIKDLPRQLLDQLPGVTRVEIENPGDCCGSAGIYNITQPKLAKQLQAKKWQAIAKANPQTVVTGNPGCLAWLTQAAEENNSPIKVVHIARFIAERCHNLQA
jgi:glycolate oxidase iron-sulfur subunit